MVGAGREAKRRRKTLGWCSILPRKAISTPASRV